MGIRQTFSYENGEWQQDIGRRNVSDNKKSLWVDGLLGYFLWAVWKLFLLLIWSLFGKKAKEWMEGIPERTLKYWTNKDGVSQKLC